MAGAVAAAVVIGVVVTRSSTSNKAATTALGKAGPVSSNLVRGGDLGNLDDAQALRAKIEPAVAPRVVDAQAANQGAGGAGASAAAGTPGQAGKQYSSPALNSTAPGQAPKCEAAARGLQPPGAVLNYEATARWQGTPADVFGFSPPGSPATSAPGRPAPTRVYALARSDCHLLVFQSFSP
jgi:hypothetical protein